jgi:hypothetical protein
MDAPYNAFYNGFRAYRDFLAVVPAVMRALPVYITETDQIDPWIDANSGWVRAAYAEINAWNRAQGAPGGQPIYCLALYRWENYDQWGFKDKHGVVDDFRASLAYDYQANPTPPIPQPEPPPLGGGSGEGDYILDWDARLNERGTALTVTEPGPDGVAWHVIIGEWFDEQQAQGRTNCFITVMDEDGNLLMGVPVTWFWQSGEETKVTERKHDSWLGHDYSLDFSMYEVAPAYGVRIANGTQGVPASDVLWGLGLGSIEQPQYKIHTAYSFTFQRMSGGSPPQPPGPEPTEVREGYVIAQAGLNVRSGPGTNYPVIGTLDYGSSVLVDKREAGWLHQPPGWMSGEYVSEDKPQPPGPGPTPLPPPPPAPTTGILDPLAAEAVYEVESGSRGYGSDGKVLIRFEAHLFERNLNDAAAFAKYFRYGDPPWTGQQYRQTPQSAWQDIHTGQQADEYNALAIARSLNDTAAFLSISMGAPQILGSNCTRIGYPHVQAMFASFQRSYAAQVTGFFNYCLSDEALATAINAHDWATVALKYNGPGQVEMYSKLMADTYARLVKESAVVVIVVETS